MKRAKPKKKSIYVKQVDPKIRHYIVICPAENGGAERINRSKT